MGFCKYCGKELDSEGRCTCAEFEEESKSGKEHIKADALTNSKAKKILIGLGIVALVAIIVAIIISIVSAANAYKKPVEKLAKGIRRANTEILMEAMYTEPEVAEMRVRIKDKGQSWEDFIKSNNKVLKNNNEVDGIKNVKAQVVAKEKLSGSNIDNIRNFYDKQFEADVKKAYRVEVKFTMKEQGEKAEYSGWLCVVKLKKGGWKYCPEFTTDEFQFINTAISTLNK